MFKEQNFHDTVFLEEYLKSSLKRWLPKREMQERYQDHKEQSNSDRNKKNCPSSSSTVPDDDEEDAIDRKVLDKNRQQDAVEEFDVVESYCESVNEEDLGDEEPLADDIKIPFFYDYSETDTAADVDEDLDLWTLSNDDRMDFICALQSKIVREFSKAVTLYEDNAKCHQDILDDHDVSILREYDVIGMTVSGAGTRLHLLNQLKPCAVIVEEAAEIIEGQLVSVLPPSIQHLVMLGDQEQLKPRVNCYQLKKKRLDCSMFERLINNKMSFTQLGQQCRMRDEIADLLRELKIYDVLKTNSEKTCHNELPDYIESSLYFVKHTEPESKMTGSNSLYNEKEIYLILTVAEKLMKNGYLPDDVTVLCPYRGQVDKMKRAFKKKSSDPKEEYFTKLKDINITTVDSFQGEENKLILLSLVRSNPKQKIGFLAERNRICVAISRARCGLYIFGNSAVYSTSQNWKKIIDLLAKKQKVGWFIPFKEEVKAEEKDDEPVSDTTKLSSRELTWLSLKIVTKWKVVAGLANLDKNKIENVDLNNVLYTEPCQKAEQILSMINKKPDFSRRKLGDILVEGKFDELVDEVLSGQLRYPTGDKDLEIVPPNETGTKS